MHNTTDYDGFEIVWDSDIGEEHTRFNVISAPYRWIVAIIDEDGKTWDDAAEFDARWADDWGTWEFAEFYIQPKG